ncbi:MAG: hypothetical protein ACYC9Z_01475 [Casimicrobiaceae bacterium]
MNTSAQSAPLASRALLAALSLACVIPISGCGGGGGSSSGTTGPPQGPAGTLDTSFGTGGIVITPFGTTASVNGIVLQPDGKIIVAGSTGNVAANQSTFALARYNADGSLDSGFGSGGKVVVPSFIWAAAQGVALQPDGKIVAAGQSGSAPNAADTSCALVRFNANGSPDAGFGAGGVVLSKPASGIATTCAGPAMLSDGKIVVAVGERGISIDSFGAIGAMQFNSDGTRDSSFGVGGETVAQVSRCCAYAYAIAVQPDGKIVVGGGAGDLPFSPTSYGQDVLARFAAGGATDPGFGSNGLVSEPANTFTAAFSTLLLQPDGKMVAVASLTGVLRFLTDGTPDSGFGASGLVAGIPGIGGALQSNGKVVIAGYGGGATLAIRADSRYGAWERAAYWIRDSGPAVASLRPLARVPPMPTPWRSCRTAESSQRARRPRRSPAGQPVTSPRPDTSATR